MTSHTVSSGLAALLAGLLVTSCGERSGNQPASVKKPDVPAAPGFQLNAKAGGIQLEPAAGALRHGTTLTVTFPTDMVDEQSLKRSQQLCPVEFKPVLPLSFHWLTPRTGEITITTYSQLENIQGATMDSGTVHKVLHTAHLRAGLKDLAGKAVSVDHWGAEFKSDAFALTTIEFVGRDEYEDSKLISQTPLVRLEFSRDVRPGDLLEHVFFQDSQSNARFPVTVGIEEKQTDKPQGWVYVEPREPLPMGRDYLLVVERLTPASEKSRLPYLRVIHAGRTVPLTLEWSHALHQPVVGPFVVLTFNGYLDMEKLEAKHFEFTPPVADVKPVLGGDETLEVHGKFDPNQSYTLTLKPGFPGAEGVTLAEPVQVEIKSFGHKRPSLIMPQEIVCRRLGQPLDLSFVQVNTKEVEWRIAAVPAAKIAAAYAGLRQSADPDDSWAFREQKELSPAQRAEIALLMPKLGLQPLAGATGKFPGADNEQEITRNITWSPPDLQKPAVYLIEVLASTLDGRIVGNHALITYGDWMAVRHHHQPTDTGSLRLLSMKNAQPAPAGVPVQPLAAASSKVDDQKTEETQKQGITGEQGVVNFPDEAFPQAGVFLVGPPSSCTLVMSPEPQDVRDYGSMKRRRSSDDGPTEPTDVTIIVTDRNLYRPGEVVRFKGFFRRPGLFTKEMDVPEELEPIEWIVSDNRSNEVARGQAKISSQGGWEGEYELPKDAQGEFSVSVGESGVPITSFRVEEYRRPLFFVRVQPADVGKESSTVQVQSYQYRGTPNAKMKFTWRAEWVSDHWNDLVRRSADMDIFARRVPAEFQLPEDQVDSRGEGGLTKVEPGNYIMTNRHSQDGALRGLSDLVLSSIDYPWDRNRADRNVPVTDVVRGEGVLDERGQAIVTASCPFPPALRHSRARVFWLVEVSDAAARTERGSALALVQHSAAALGCRLQSEGEVLSAAVAAFDSRNAPVTGLELTAELFRIDSNVAKEVISENYVRYLNTPVFVPVWKKTQAGPWTLPTSITEPGDYVLRVSVPSDPSIPVVSDMVFFEGGSDYEDEERATPITSDSKLTLTPNQSAYRVGETASLRTDSPFGGTAIVRVESAAGFYDEFLAVLPGNNAPITLRLRPEHAPNVFISAHLIKPEPDVSKRPLERLGVCELKVSNPEHVIEVKLEAPQLILPGSEVTGSITVTSAGKPMPDSEILLYAVDESVLRLGDYELPDFMPVFHPSREAGDAAGLAMHEFWQAPSFDDLNYSQKGFILGDGGPIVLGDPNPRRRFDPLAHWNAFLKPNDKGVARFKFDATDGVGTYRLIAIAQARAARFGKTEQLMQQRKTLECNSVLPRFVRAGDRTTLRAVIRQETADVLQVEVGCIPGPGVALASAALQTLSVPRGQDVVATFEAKVAATKVSSETPGTTNVQFTVQAVSDTSLRDAEEIPLQVLPAQVIRRMMVAEKLGPDEVLDLSARLPVSWRGRQGSASLLLSTSSVRPRLHAIQHLLPENAENAVDVLRELVVLHMHQESGGTLGFELDEDHIKARFNALIQRLLNVRRSSGGIKLWPTSPASDTFVTALAAMAIQPLSGEVFNGVDELKFGFDAYLSSVLNREEHYEDHPILQAYATMGLAIKGKPFSDQDIERVKTLYAERAALGEEGRAALLIALVLAEDDKLQDDAGTLAQELEEALPKVEAPASLPGNRDRVEAVVLAARLMFHQDDWSDVQKAAALTKVEAIIDRHAADPGFETLLLLTLLQGLDDSETTGDIVAALPKAITPTEITGENDSAYWDVRPLSALLRSFPEPLRLGMTAQWQVIAALESTLSDEKQPQGFEARRQVRSLSGSGEGTEAKPFAAGELVLITYEMNCAEARHHVRLTDELPGCFDSINTNLPSIKRTYAVPVEAGTNVATPRYISMGDASIRLNFDQVPAGRSTFSVLAVVTNDGAYQWPSLQAATVFDARFSALAGARSVVVKTAPAPSH